METIIKGVRDFVAGNEIQMALDLCSSELFLYLSVAQKDSLTLMHKDYHDILGKLAENSINFTDAQVETTKISRRILTLLNKLESEPEIAFERFNIEKALLIRSFNYAFLERTKFRKEVISHISTKISKTLLINGGPKSGISYLEQFLRHFSEINNDTNIKIIPINMEKILNSPTSGKSAKILEILFANIGEDLPATGDDIKFIRLGNALREVVHNNEMFPIFFFHDFHKAIFIPEDVYRLIYELINIPTNCLFIFSGLEYNSIPNWNDIRNSCKFDKISAKDITRETIVDCFSVIFNQYEENIINSLGGKHIQCDEYCSLVSEKIFVDGEELDICKVGNIINDHLFNLKKY